MIHELNPERAQENWVLASHKRQKGRPDEAQEALELLWEIINPDTGFQPSMLKAYWLAAEINLDHGFADEALKCLDLYKGPSKKRGEQLTKDEIQTLFLKARCQFDLKNWAECKNLLSLISENDHANLDAVQMKADLNLETNNTGEAIRIYQSLLDRDHNTKTVMFSMAQAYFLSQNYAQANQYLTKLKEMGVVDPAVEHWFKLTQQKIYDESIRKDPTISFLDKVIMRFFPFYAASKILQYTHKKLIEDTTQAIKFKDELTGLYSKDAVGVYLPNFFQKARERFFIGRGDLDFFKSINDIHGHDVGDRVLSTFGKIAGEYFPNRAFRMGGDEFLWCFDGTESACLNQAKAFRKALETRARDLVNAGLLEKPIRDINTDEMIFLNWELTCSQGIAEWTKDLSQDKALSEADGNQYSAKQSAVGRNAIFFKNKLVDKGERPIPYTVAIVKHLDLFAKGKNFADWWNYLESTKDQNAIKEALAMATKQETDEKKALAEKSS
jgi:diguanylate cyclase (GGDEF)-like protein